MKNSNNHKNVLSGQVQVVDPSRKSNTITRFDAVAEINHRHVSASVPAVSEATTRDSRVSGAGGRLVKVDYLPTVVGAGGIACLSW